MLHPELPGRCFAAAPNGAPVQPSCLYEAALRRARGLREDAGSFACLANAEPMLEAALRESDLEVDLQHGEVGAAGLAAPRVSGGGFGDCGNRSHGALPVAHRRMLRRAHLRLAPASLDVLSCGCVASACGDLSDLLAPEVLRIGEHLEEPLEGPAGVRRCKCQGLNDLGPALIEAMHITALQEFVHPLREPTSHGRSFEGSECSYRIDGFDEDRIQAEPVGCQRRPNAMPYIEAGGACLRHERSVKRSVRYAGEKVKSTWLTRRDYDWGTSAETTSVGELMNGVGSIDIIAIDGKDICVDLHPERESVCDGLVNRAPTILLVLLGQEHRASTLLHDREGEAVPKGQEGVVGNAGRW